MPFSTTINNGLVLALHDGGLGSYTNNDPVGSWNDAAASNHATQGVSNKRPICITSMSPNGKPGVRFDGTDDSLSTPSINLSTTDDITFVVLLKGTGTPSGSQHFEFTTNFDGSGGFILYRTSDDKMSAAIGHAGLYNEYKSSVSASDSFRVFAATYDRSLLSNEVEVFSNNALSGAYTINQNTPTVNFADAPLFIGSRNNVSNYIQGDVLAILLYSRKLSSTELGTIYNELNTYYITASGNVAPAAPSNLVAVAAGPNQVNLTWQDNS